MTHGIHDKIRTLEIQLKELDVKKVALLEELKKAHIEMENSTSNIALIETHTIFSPEEKIKIFMNLFRGRIEVFPKRWDNAKTGKSGYSPTCSKPARLKLKDLRSSHDSHPRNKQIAMAFYERGWIEMWGTGTTRMIEFCRKNGTPEPEFHEYAGGFSVVFPFKEPMNTLIVDEPLTIQLTSRQQEILSILGTRGEMSLNALRENLKHPPAISTLREDLTLLKSKGILDYKGKARATMWFLIKK